MANQFGFLSEETYAEKMDTQNKFLAAILSAQGGSVKPTTWSQVQALVRSGLAEKVFAIGDQLVCEKGGATLVWDVIGINHDTPSDKQFANSMTIQLHDCINSYQYDNSEAFYYAENGLAAGTYNVTCGVNWGTNCVAGKTYQFTLTKAVPAGGQLVGFSRMPDTTIGSWTVSTYQSNSSTTAIESATVTEGSAGTSLGTFQVAIQGNLNSLHRLAYGSNNWVESAMRQYLNSDKAAGSVWTPKTKFDRPPSWLTSLAGFKNGLDEDFLAVIGETTKVTCRNTVTDGGGSDTTKDKFFLLSRPEVFCGAEVSSVDEGTPYPYYSDYSDYTSPNTGVDSNRVKYRGGAAQYWWLRTPNSGSGVSVRFVYASGGLHSYYAYYSFGVSPACNII